MPLGVSVRTENHCGGETLLAFGSVWALRKAFCFFILYSLATPSLICFLPMLFQALGQGRDLPQALPQWAAASLSLSR